MADKKTVRLTHLNGTTVVVRADKKDALLRMGFTEPKSSTSKS